MSGAPPAVIYWDASAVLSALFEDGQSTEALEHAGRDGVHLLSTLSLAETIAVVHRVGREGMLADLLVGAALESLETGPWRVLRLAPLAADVRDLANRWPLRGADLWHLATIRTLARELPEVRMLTFDQRLHAAACQEGLAPP